METNKELEGIDTFLTGETTEEITGKFIESLKRNNAKIRADRAASIAEDAEMIYKREIEDLYLQIKKLKRERDTMLDLSPTSADSLILASDFDSKAFVKKDLELAVLVRNLEIKLDLATRRYEYLFK